MKKFMLLVKATPETEAGVMPRAELIAEMGVYNEALIKAGMLLDAGGLHPSSRAARVHFDGDARHVTDGPFTETKELVGGFWLIQAASLEEAVDWVKRVPNLDGTKPQIEIRQLFDASDFGAA